MGGINTGRWLLGGVVAGIVIWICEGIAADAMTDAPEAHNLSMDMSAGMMIMTVVVSLLVGLTLVFFYAGVRPRFGPGPKTAAVVAAALWLGGHLVALIGYQMVDLYPTGMLVR
jgi:heme/copper-type cytochrome/quinol oxidase subunit 2